MALKSFKKTTDRPLPRSVLASLHEPLLDPKDGHGARTKRDVMILQKWEAAKKGDDDALIDLLKLIVRENLADLKNARSTRRYIFEAGGKLQMRSLVPVMSLLGMISAEKVRVPSEPDGWAKVTSRRKITLAEWFEDYGFGRAEVDPEAAEEVADWIARGAIQRPFRGEPQD